MKTSSLFNIIEKINPTITIKNITKKIFIKESIYILLIKILVNTLLKV